MRPSRSPSAVAEERILPGGDVVLYGQSARTRPVHTALKALDVFNLRHRLIALRRGQELLATVVGGVSGETDIKGFRSSRVVVRQSPSIVVAHA